MKRDEKLRLGIPGGWRKTLDDKIYSSVFAKYFRRFTNWLYSLLINGFFGKIFTAYSAEEELFFNSRTVRFFTGGKRVRNMVAAAKLRMARAFENSRILTALSALVSSLIHRKLKTYGAFLLSMGAYGFVTYIVRVYVLARGSEDLTVVFTCAVFLLLAFPMMASRETFATAAFKSRVMSTLLFRWLGIPRDSFGGENVQPKRYSFVTAMGMAFGALTYFIHPIYYVLAAIALIALALIFSYPEIGVLALIAFVPFSVFSEHPSVILFLTVIATSMSYFVKLMRGKRVVKFHLVDIAILVFANLLWLGGIISSGGEASFASSSMYFILMFGYFLTVNLMRTKEWIRRCVATVLLCGGLSALVGVVQIFIGSFDTSWLDTEIFSDISTRITATFDNPNVYATYLLLVIPFVSVALLSKELSMKKLPSIICLLLLVLCLVETWSRGAWLGILIAAILFFLIYSRRSLPYILLGFAVVPMATPFLPDNVISRFASIGSASDSSSVYRISAWKGVFRMLKENWLGGIGVGESAFSAVYPAFAYAGIEGIRHSHNLYLQILSEIGLPGLLMFVIVMVLFVQNCFECLYKLRNETETTVVSAGLVAVIAVLIMGLTDYVWYSYRVFLMFWLVVALVNAYIRISLSEFNRTGEHEKNTLYSVNLDLSVDNL